MSTTCVTCQQPKKILARGMCSACYQKARARGLPALQRTRPYGPERPCTHQTSHPHGARARYVLDRCRCEKCTASTRTYENERERRRAIEKWHANTSALVPGDTVRAHLRELMDAGMGWKRIAAAAGVGCSTVYPILYGKHLSNPAHPDHRPPRKQVRREVAEKLLAVRYMPAGGTLIESTGARRRLQALVAIGWSQTRLAAVLGMELANLNTLILGRGQRMVTQKTADAVRALYDRCWLAPPIPANRFEQSGITRARHVAQDHDWAPPLAWDDDEIDDPDARPQGLPGATPALSVTEQVVELLEIGYSVTEIPSRVGRASLADVLGCIRDRELKAELTRRAS
ncbi:MAG: hypothetical protein HY829_10645 [Actinobacteria bacterium]|nr:hypothetical protein [Actinomycetota bacterium]